VLWLGGLPAVGKTTAARRFCESHGLRLYTLDDRTQEHLSRLPPETRGLEEEWATITPEEAADIFELRARARFPFVVEDLLALPGGAPVLAEGPHLLPDLVAPLLAGRDRALFVLLPSEVQRVGVRERVGDRYADTSDPERALESRLARDDVLAGRFRRLASTHKLSFVELDDISETAPALERYFLPILDPD
jgi:predicted kinase